MPPGLGGVLAFQSDVAGRPAIYTLALGTGAVARLSGDPRWTETNPRWSPDGTRLVFASNRAHYEGPTPEGGTPDFDLWVVGADGSGRRRLTTDPANETDPAWDADGRGIVFSSDRDSRGDLYRVALDTGATTRLTRHYVGRAIMPAPAPAAAADGSRSPRRRCAWARSGTSRCTCSRPPAPRRRCRHRPAPAGRRGRRDGQRLAHVSLGKDEPSSLMVRTMGDGPSTRIPGPRELWSYYPEWSPDDSKLAFAVSPAHHEGENWDLAVVDLKTGAWSRLTEGPGNDRLPDWKP